MTRVKQILVVAAAGLALAAAPALAQPAQTKQQQQSGSRPASGRPSSGTAVARPSGGGSPGAPSAPRPAGPSGMSSSRPSGPSGVSSGSRGARAVPRSGPAPSRAVGGDRPNTPRGSREVPQYSRPRGNRVAVGSAAERSSRPPGRPPGGWYPGYPTYPSYPWYGYPGWNWGWGYGYPYYGGFGIGFFSYDPYSWGGSYYYGGGYATSGQYTDTGKLRLKVKPRDAQVFVDGYYMGIVDEFDGTFQRLRLETGGHRVELRLDGYQPLTFDVLIPLGETITYRGELKRQ